MAVKGVPARKSGKNTGRFGSGVLIALKLVFVLILIIIPVSFYDDIVSSFVFKNSEVYAYISTMPYASAPLFIMWVVLVLCLADMVFKNSPFLYGSTAEDVIGSTFFGKKLRAHEPLNKTKYGKYILEAVCVLFAVSLTFSIFGRISRIELTSTGITEYSSFNKVINEIPNSEFEKTTLIISSEMMGSQRRGPRTVTGLKFSVHLNSGDTVELSDMDFHNNKAIAEAAREYNAELLGKYAVRDYVFGCVDLEDAYYVLELYEEKYGNIDLI